jgi:hypothetical protein
MSFYLKVKLLPGSSSSALFRSASAPWKSPSFRFTSPLTLEQRQQISLAKFLGSLKEFCLPCTFGLGFRVYANYARYVSFIGLDFDAP